MKSVVEDGQRSTVYHKATDGFAMAKSIAFNNDGTEFYVADTIMQHVHIFSWDADEEKLVKKEEPSVLISKGRIDNMKPIEGFNHVMAGAIESFQGNIQFELQRKEEDWDNVKNVEECIGGAEEYRRNEEGIMESRYQVVSSKINGWSNGAKVG